MPSSWASTAFAGSSWHMGHVVLGFPGVLADAFALITAINLDEVAKLHIGVCVPLKQKLPFPFLRIALELEAPLHLLAPCAGEIGVVERGVEGSVLFIPVGWQSHHLLLGQTIELLLKVFPADSPGNGGIKPMWSIRLPAFWTFLPVL